MNTRGWNAVKWMIIASLLFPLLAACGQIDLSASYPLESVARDGSSTSYIYRAENTPVPEAAEAIAEQRRPEQISETSTERMFLVYRDELIQIQQDPANPDDSLIEVDSKEYVKNNYDRSFLEMYIQYRLLDTLSTRSVERGLPGICGSGITSRRSRTGRRRPRRRRRFLRLPSNGRVQSFAVARTATTRRSAAGSIFKRTPSDSDTRGSITRNKRSTTIRPSTRRRG